MIQPLVPARRAGEPGVIHPRGIIIFKLYPLAVYSFYHHGEINAVQKRGIIGAITQTQRGRCYPLKRAVTCPHD